MSGYDDHFPAATKDEGQITLGTAYSDAKSEENSRNAGDFVASDRPKRTQEMVYKGQIWVGMTYPDGSKGWEIRGTGAIIDKDPYL